MNKFRTAEMRSLIDGLRKRAKVVYLAAEASVAEDIAQALTDAADSLEDADRYYCAVEGALV